MTPEQPMHLLIELADGSVIERDIAPALPVTDQVGRGTAIEEALHNAAATWGLPDFVFPPVKAAKGANTREVGDGLLLVGRRGVIIQSKGRDEPGPNAQRESSWINKKVAEAFSQAKGSIRTLRDEPQLMTNRRGREIEVDGNQIDWCAVVILDHPGPPNVVPNIPDDLRMPAVVLLRRDWEFLFDQLKSGWAVAGYLNRVGAREPVELGDEPLRYYELAQADAATVPERVDPRLLGRSGQALSTPELPLRAAGSDDDPTAQSLVRMVLEDAATGPWTTEADESMRLLILAELDRLPVARRALFGHFFLDALEEANQKADADTTIWRLKRFQGPAGEPHIVLGACSAVSRDHRIGFAQLMQLRHYERHQLIGGDDGGITVGVFLTLRHDGVRGFDTTLSAVSGSLEIDREDLEALTEHWGTGSDF